MREKNIKIKKIEKKQNIEKGKTEWRKLKKIN